MGKVVLTSTEAAAAKTDADSAVKTTDAAAKTANAAAKAAPDDAALANAAKFADEAKAAAKTAADEAKAVVDAITTADNAKAKADASALIASAPSATDAEIATAATDAAAAVAAELAASIDTNDTAIISRQHNVMLQVSPLYKAVMMRLREVANVLPPSAAMAGAYKATDSSVGTHQAPANISLISVSKPMVNLDDHEQEGLNVPIDGKAINAIRSFPGKGVLVWGARTMDGNSQDWRYISVRRTVSMIELSIKYAAEVFVFQPNNSSTWSNLKAMITNFLTNMWYAGALAGATPESAFSVDVGIGTTMTSVDILDGYMRVSVKIAVTRPAEFIVITFEQQMQTS
jgi:phage tail sheath protein FI